MIITRWNRLSVDHSRCFPTHVLFLLLVRVTLSLLFPFIPLRRCSLWSLWTAVTCHRPLDLSASCVCVCVCVCVRSACTHIPVVIGESSSPLLSYITPYASLCWCWCVGSPICPQRRCSESKCLDAWVEDINRDEEKAFFVTTQHRSTSAALNMWQLYVVHLPAFLLLLCFTLPFLSNPPAYASAQYGVRWKHEVRY